MLTTPPAPPLSHPKALIDSRYKKVYDGRATTDQEIVGLLIALLFAGQHTSSITSTWTGLYMMAGDQKYYKVRPGCRVLGEGNGGSNPRRVAGQA